MIRAALAGILALGAACAGAQVATAAAPAEDSDPLLVHIDTISPVLPRSGDVEITGTVTNVSDDTFTRINLHAFSSQAPILDTANLAASAGVDPAIYVGPRVTTPGTFDTVDVLDPGETARFSDSVPVELLEIPEGEGVYWIGIHAIGDGATPRDDVADGRARTFIPARPEGGRTQEAAVILPVRHRIWYDGDGRVSGTERWARRLEEGGSLDGILDMADSAGATPYSWLVDPAVLDALDRLAAGNPPRTLAPDPDLPAPEPTDPESPTDGATTATPEAPTTPEAGASPETLNPTPPESTEAPSEADSELAVAAQLWLTRFTELVGTEQVLVLPFGDIDVSAAVRHGGDAYELALTRAAEVMGSRGLSARFAVAPSSDVLTPEAIARTPDSAVILLGDNAFALPPETSGSVVEMLGRKIVVTSTGAEAGGPGPTAASDPLALRQRLLSEAALRQANDDRAPVVVTLPTVWRGEDASSFFTDLEQPWMEVVDVADVAAGTATDALSSDLAYTDEDLTEELDEANFTAAARAMDTATLTETVLTLPTTIESQVRDEVLVTLSEQHRAAPRLARRAADGVDAALRDELAKVTIEAPTSVTLSSDSGKLGTTLVNGLDQPVTVQVAATTDGDLTLDGDSVRELGPQSRSVVRFEASTDQPGTHRVRLSVTTVDGVPLGATAELPIRAARVSALIWVAMVGGALVLFGMIGYRLPGQIRARRRELADKERSDAAAPSSSDPDPGPLPGHA